ncbi:MAG: HD domain-containing protein, partial [Candidatus Thorarchaeota archaeon]
MYLQKNIKILNEKYTNFGIHFELNCQVIRIIEDTPFSLNNNPDLKEELKQKYNISFNQVDKWHLGKYDVERFRKKRIAFKPQKPLQILAKYLLASVNQIEEVQLRQSIFQLLKHFWKFFYYPAAIYYHHNYPYGLFEHTVETIQNAILISKGRDNIELDQDLLIAGALLHDIGKINCYEITSGKIIFTELGEKQGHIVNGI